MLKPGVGTLHGSTFVFAATGGNCVVLTVDVEDALASASHAVK